MSRAGSILRRLLPRRLAGQIIWLLLLALMLSQFVTLAFFLHERREVVRSVTQEQVLLRVAGAVRLLDETPPALHRRVVRGANTPASRNSLYAMASCMLLLSEFMPCRLMRLPLLSMESCCRNAGSLRSRW